MRIVIKVSGHLYKHFDKAEELFKILEDLVDKGVKIAIVPGGSVFADTVKEFQRAAKLDDDVAHWMAIKAMEIYGLFLSRLSRRISEAYSLEDALNALEKGLIPLIMPYKILRKHDELPHSWDVSSDSIAVYIAYLLKGDIVVLGKMVKGLTDGKGNTITCIDVDNAIRFVGTVIDPYVTILLRRFKIPLAIFDMKNPKLLYKVVKLIPSDYTIIVSEPSRCISIEYNCNTLF